MVPFSLVNLEMEPNVVMVITIGQVPRAIKEIGRTTNSMGKGS